jgi:hypothetical protein
MFIPDPDLDFFIHPGSRSQKGAGFRIQIRNTAENDVLIVLEISCGESGYGGSVKSEPSSPFSFPPSPTGSDHRYGILELYRQC